MCNTIVTHQALYRYPLVIWFKSILAHPMAAIGDQNGQRIGINTAPSIQNNRLGARPKRT